MAWMHACREALRLMSRERDEPLTPWERWQLGLHRRLCGDCARAGAQLKETEVLTAAWLRGEDDEEGAQR